MPCERRLLLASGSSPLNATGTSKAGRHRARLSTTDPSSRRNDTDRATARQAVRLPPRNPHSSCMWMGRCPSPRQVCTLGPQCAHERCSLVSEVRSTTGPVTAPQSHQLACSFILLRCCCPASSCTMTPRCVSRPQPRGPHPSGELKRKRSCLCNCSAPVWFGLMSARSSSCAIRSVCGRSGRVATMRRITAQERLCDSHMRLVKSYRLARSTVPPAAFSRRCE